MLSSLVVFSMLSSGVTVAKRCLGTYGGIHVGRCASVSEPGFGTLAAYMRERPFSFRACLLVERGASVSERAFAMLVASMLSMAVQFPIALAADGDGAG